MMRSSNRNVLFFLLLTAFVFVSFYLYGSLDNATTERREQAARSRNDVEELRKKVAGLELQLHENAEQMKKVRGDLEKSESERKNMQIEKENEIYDEKQQAENALEHNIDINPVLGNGEDEKKVALKPPPQGNKVAVVHNVISQAKAKKRGQCSILANYSGAATDVQMLEMYNIIPFDNVDGGVWKQGWEITYDIADSQKEKKLEVVVIPHSHCDPGWIMTFESYYNERTKNILSGMARHLEKKSDMKFIYAEMSFFEMWWAEQDESTREKVRRYLKSGQFEIVTGGWVMTDEANSHFYSIVTELFEGHEFIMNHIGADIVPRAHWSIDPFGLSPSIPLLLSESNITNAVLQRVHYSVKKKLAQTKQLEFMWRQLWGGSVSKNDVRTHVFPFYSYDVPHTCGPEPKVCCQFDFKRLPGGGYSCDWGVPPQPITEKNVQARAFMIYDQYRKKSQLYKTNVLLVPLGDDFRYQDDFEWDNQYTNYKKLFEFMNKNPEWNVHARFGTLSDYFSLLDENVKEEDSKLPVLSGDFFTYADRDDHYWSGYFTSRPFHKQMDRVLQHYLRSAEIVYSLARLHMKELPPLLFSKLVQARRALSLFQHHDGVTGTAKDHVVKDYGEKMLGALQKCGEVISSSVGAMVQGDQAKPSVVLDLDEYRSKQDSLPEKRTLFVGSSLVLFNSLAQHRSEVVCIQVSSPTARISSAQDGAEPEQQLGPVVSVVDGRLESGKGVYELCFFASVGPLSSETFTLDSRDGTKNEELVVVKGSQKPANLDQFFTFATSSGDFELSNGLVAAQFSGVTGALRTLVLRTGETVDINAHFVKYGARPHGKLRNGGGDNLSGAYLFLPDGNANKLEVTEPAYVVLEGSLVKKVLALGPKDGKLIQQFVVEKGSHSVGISNTIDLRNRPENIEIAMRLETSVVSGDDFYTDLNGLQMIRRRRMLSKLPLQAHFYPMPGSAYIEDSKMRISLLGAQSLGVASLKSGWLEVMLDRRLQQDDNRGLFQPVLDNVVTVSHFRLLVEPLSSPHTSSSSSAPPTVGFLSAVAHQDSLRLHYPWVKLLAKDAAPASKFTGLSSPFPCDTHLVTLRTMAKPTDYENNRRVEPRNESALVLHRWVADCRSALPAAGCSAETQIDVKRMFGSGVKSVSAASLTLLYEQGGSSDVVEVEPQHVRTVKVTY